MYYELNALYNEVSTLNENFTEEEIALMFYTLEKNKDYLKTIWGEWMKARDLCILAALRYMLLRPNEACSLAFNDFNFEKMQLHVRGINNKERKDRFIQVPDKFIKYYKEYMSFPRWMWKDSPYLFPSAENPHIHAQRWKMIMREKILKPSGLYRVPEGRAKSRTSYLLRSSGATELLDKGSDPWTVAQTLGHGDLRTVKNYFFQTDRFRKKQRDALNTLS